MKSIKTTPWNLMVHEFNKTIRIFSKKIPINEMLKDIIQQKNSITSQLAKNIGYAAILYIILISNENVEAINISILKVDIELKKIYLIFLSSLFLLQAINDILNFLAYNKFQQILANKQDVFANSTMMAVLQDKNGMPGLLLNYQYKFFKESRARLSWMNILTFILIGLSIAIVIRIYFYNLTHSFEKIITYSSFSFEYFLCIATTLLLLSILLLLKYSITPFSFEKNTNYIRWNFLQVMYRKNKIWHPNTELWLDNIKQEK